MIKSELVQFLARKQPHLSHSDVDAAVTLLINKMINELASGGRVSKYEALVHSHSSTISLNLDVIPKQVKRFQFHNGTVYISSREMI